MAFGGKTFIHGKEGGLQIIVLPSRIDRKHSFLIAYRFVIGYPLFELRKVIMFEILISNLIQ